MSCDLVKKLGMAVIFSSLSYSAFANNDWKAQLTQSLQQSEQWQQVKAQQRAVQAENEAARQPLYNPELAFDYEDKTERAYQVSVSQTIDLFDRRETQSQIAGIAEQLSALRTQQQQTLLMEQVLVALLESRRAVALEDLSETQLNISERIIQLTRQRVRAGDASEVDLQLVKLAQTEALEARNAARSMALQNQTEVDLLLGGAQVNLPGAFNSFNYSNLVEPDLSGLSQHSLSSQIANLEAQKGQLGVVKAAKESRAEPTIGLGLGQDGDDNVVALSLSIPLNVRNTYRAEVTAAEALAAARDSEFRLVQRQTYNELKRSWSNLVQQQTVRKLLGDARQQSMQTLNQQLEKLWRLGELDTTRYLQSLQQSNSALKAQINLNTESDLALINWLARSNQLLSWLSVH
jgi:outer membrane protein TolC